MAHRGPVVQPFYLKVWEPTAAVQKYYERMAADPVKAWIRYVVLDAVIVAKNRVRLYRVHDAKIQAWKGKVSVSALCTIC